jgi:hypothetical protein
MERFQWGIDMFLNGVRNSPRTVTEQENA